MSKKAQTAVEFLTTYGWVIMGVIILLAILTYYGTFNPLRFVPRQCNFEPGLPCTSYKLEVNSTTGNMKLLVQLSNDLGYDISLPESAMLIHVENLGKPGKNTYLGNCTPRLPYVIKKGGTFTCIVDITDKEVIPSIGKNIRLEADLNYKNCLTDPNYISTGNCSGAANYTSAGTAVTPMEGYSAALYCGDGICSASIGENPSTCPMDCPPAASIILDASPSIVAPDGVSYSTITATVRDRNGQLMSNMEVVFTSTIGKFSSYTAVTSSGKARVNITSAQAGVATVTGIVPSVSNTTTVKFYYVPSSITLSHSLTAPCSNKSQVVATVRDQGGNRIQDMEVVFSHDATGIASLTPASDVTNSSGKANTIFYDSKLISEKVTLTARAYMPELGITLTNSTVLDYTPSSIVLSSSRTFVCGNDFGVTAHVTDRYGNAVCGCDILFTHNATGAASLNPTSNTTNSLGDVTSLFLYDKDEEVKVEAKVNMPGAAFGLSESVVVNSGAPIVLTDEWVISTNVVCSNVTIIPYENIRIIDGGSLTLKCVNLVMNESPVLGPEPCFMQTISVESGGKLFMYPDPCPVTVEIADKPDRCPFSITTDPGSTFYVNGASIDFGVPSAYHVTYMTSSLNLLGSSATLTNSNITGGTSLGNEYWEGISVGKITNDFETNDVTITNNQISNCLSAGIMLEQGVRYSTVSGNTISNCYYGVRLNYCGVEPWSGGYTDRCGHNTVANNVISDSIYGILIVGTGCNTISGNTIVLTARSQYGIDMWASGYAVNSSKNAINSNTITTFSSSDYGVNCDGNISTFSGNSIYGPGDCCDSCSGCPGTGGSCLGADCRTTGCPSGQSCQLCAGSYMCSSGTCPL